MKIYKIEIENFRLLKNFTIDIEPELSLVIGKNNVGKTSILSVLDKFINEKSKFHYEDFNIDFITEFESLIEKRKISEEFSPKGIKLRLFIEYDENDDLSNLSNVLMDLDPENNKIVLGFEYTISYSDFQKIRTEYKSFIDLEKIKVKTKKRKKLRELKDFLKIELHKYFQIRKYSFEYDGLSNQINFANFVDLVKEGITIKDIISFKFISARREVTNKDNEKTLSLQTSSLYKKKEINSSNSQATESFKDQLSDTDNTLSDIYKDLFVDVISKIRTFGGIKLNDTEIEIISTLQHKDLLDGNTTVVYTFAGHKLPESYNGLGYMNLISMIFEIEILIQDFKRNKEKKPSDINLLFIEEPEAHTHPQMQYVFIKNIKALLAEGIKGDDDVKRPLQYIITTHSSHIVADSDFDDLKYLKAESKNNVVAKNLSALRKQYDTDPSQYQFLKQYLTISRAEIFFADKAVLIEGDTERILIPTFMRKVDLEESTRLIAEGNENTFLPLLSQNISIIEAGAYSHIFEKFIDFLGIKSLILTDIDAIKVSGKDKNGHDVWVACPVSDGTKTSNSAINHFLKGVAWNDLTSLSVADRIIPVGSSTVYICYQQEEDSYHARSFEDAFIHLNREFIKENKTTFQGLKNVSYFDDAAKSSYELADTCIKKKTHFALDILYHSDKDIGNWKIPAYISEGLLWLNKD
jgi:predicted ATP-dependent endonuclease of OLD family